jgi:hypothetical protein
MSLEEGTNILERHVSTPFSVVLIGPEKLEVESIIVVTPKTICTILNNQLN